MSPLGELRIEDRKAVGLKVQQKGLRDISIYFDKKTGLPLKCGLMVPKRPDSTDEIQFSLTLTYAGYKEFGGIQHFTRLTGHREREEVVTVELSNIQLHESLDAGLFAKPRK